MKKAVVLLSGGLDSSTCMAIAKNDGYEIYALSFDYGQRHDRELESARAIARHFGAKEHLILKMELDRIGGSALTDGSIEVLRTGMKTTWRRTSRSPMCLRGTPYS